MTGPPRLAVALETSTRPSSIAVQGGDGAIVERSLDGDRSHASDLLVEIADAVSGIGADRADLDLVVVGTGPGSYTGLRVGAATALGLHRGAAAALVGVPSFDVIARASLTAGETGTIVRNAFGGQVYVGTYRAAADGVDRVGELACVRPDELLGGLESDTVLLVDGDALRALGVEESSLDVEVRPCDPPSARTLLELGLDRFAREGAGGPESVQPLYLRPFEAKVRKR